jgi:hypothetical protein
MPDAVMGAVPPASNVHVMRIPALPGLRLTVWQPLVYGVRRICRNADGRERGRSIVVMRQPSNTLSTL